MTGILNKQQEPKISNSLVNGYSVLPMTALQGVRKQDNSVTMNLWNRLNNLYTTPWVKNFIGRNNPTILFKENHHFDPKSSKRESYTEKGKAESDLCDSLILDSKQLCLKFSAIFASDSKAEDSLSKPFRNSNRNSKCEAKLYNSNKFGCRILSEESINKPKNQPFRKVIFQRLDSGIDELPHPNCTQIDLDSLHLTSVIKMDDTHDPCVLVKEESVLGRVYHQAVSFFIDIREPLLQKPLGEEYNFRPSSDCDSVFSDQCLDCSDDDSDDDDDDFVIFEETSLDETEEINCSLNTSSSYELSSYLRSNSTVKTCFDISIGYSRNGSQMDALQEVDSTNSLHNSGCPYEIMHAVSMKTSPYGICTLKENQSIASRDHSYFYNCSCCDLIGFSTHEVKSDIVCDNSTRTSKNTFGVCTMQEKKHTLFPKGNSTKTPHCGPTVNPTEEVFPRKIPSKSETSCLDYCAAEKKKSKKKVCFESEADLVIVHQMRYWDYAYRKARKGSWEQAAADRCRFWRRIQELDAVLSPCLKRRIELIKMSDTS